MTGGKGALRRHERRLDRPTCAHPILTRVAVFLLAALSCAGLALVVSGSASAAGTPSAPVVILDPNDASVAVGQTATFTARANGNPTPNILWQIHTPTGKGFQAVKGQYSSTLTLKSVTMAMSGSVIHAFFKNSVGSAYTTNASLTVLAVAGPTVTVQPTSEARPIGASATFTAEASGEPVPSVQWLARAPGASAFKPISGARSTTLVVPNLKGSQSGTRYEAVFKNPGGTATTVAATVTVSPVAHLVLSPSATTIATGVHQQYSSHAFDAKGADLGDVTPSTAFQIGPVGTCTAGACWSTTVGAHTVTGTMDGVSATATLNVATVTRLAVTPNSVSLAPGAAQTFQAEGFDAGNNDLGNVTASATFSMSPNGNCSGSTCSASSLGPHQVTAAMDSANGSAAVNVVQLASLTISPGAAAVPPGMTESFQAEAFDSSGNDLGDVTRWTTFNISPDGSCSGATCQATALGYHKVTGTDGPGTGSARVLITKKFVELMFSRTEVTAADGASCLADDAGVARLDTTVEPFLHQLGLSATGSIETGPTTQSTLWCAHDGETLATSWAFAQKLATYGWTFVTHSMTYPTAQDWANESPGQQWDETCGAAQTIDANGLPGASSAFLWPNNVVDNSVLGAFVEPCFGTNRIYGYGETTSSEVSTAPYQQSVEGLSGGPCDATNAPCHTIPGTVTQYNNPNQIIAQIKSLPANSVLTLQVYLLVTGTSPSYTTNTTKWDCTSPNPTLHWTNDAERYCWSDLQGILQYLANAGIGIVQPGTVNAAYGRTGYSDHAVPRPNH